jgi:hypothetical protein
MNRESSRYFIDGRTETEMSRKQFVTYTRKHVMEMAFLQNRH